MPAAQLRQGPRARAGAEIQPLSDGEPSGAAVRSPPPSSFPAARPCSHTAAELAVGMGSQTPREVEQQALRVLGALG